LTQGIPALGVRSKRYAMIVEDGVVKWMAIDTKVKEREWETSYYYFFFLILGCC